MLILLAFLGPGDKVGDMKRRSFLGIFAAAIAAFILPVAAMAQQDVYGSGDYHDLPRMEGGTIRAYRELSNADVTLPTGPVATRDDEIENTVRLQGAITHWDYVIRPTRPSAEVERYYEALLRDGGFETVFACAGMARCGNRLPVMILNDGKVAPVGFADGLFNDHIRVRVARKGATWVLLHMIQGPDRALVYQAVIEGARELE